MRRRYYRNRHEHKIVMDSKDPMGDRMKLLEQHVAGQKLLSGLPVVVRLDGRCFSSLTKDCTRPFDASFHAAMVSTTYDLVEEFSAIWGYTQSDEITLLWNPKIEAPFGGKTHKINSCVAAFASVMFSQYFWNHDIVPTFDCRVWVVPSLEEAVNCVLWREFDAVKNSVSMAARAVASHKELLGLSSKEMQELLFQRGINWNDYPTEFKRGSHIRRTRKLRALTEEELDRIPESHRPIGPVERFIIEKIELPPLQKILNRTKVIFEGSGPIFVSGA